MAFHRYDGGAWGARVDGPDNDGSDVPDGAADTAACLPADSIQDGAADAPSDPGFEGPEGEPSGVGGCGCTLLLLRKRS